MVTFHIPPPYRPYTSQAASVQVAGSTVSEAFSDLLVKCPDLGKQVQNPRGEIRPFINIIVNGSNIKILLGLNTPLHPGDVLHLVPNVAGG